MFDRTIELHTPRLSVGQTNYKTFYSFLTRGDM